MKIQESINSVLDGEGLLFIGAGFSQGAKNIRNNSLKNGSDIAIHFAQLVRLPVGIGFQRRLQKLF